MRWAHVLCSARNRQNSRKGKIIIVFLQVTVCTSGGGAICVEFQWSGCAVMEPWQLGIYIWLRLFWLVQMPRSTYYAGLGGKRARPRLLLLCVCAGRCIVSPPTVEKLERVKQYMCVCVVIPCVLDAPVYTFRYIFAHQWGHTDRRKVKNLWGWLLFFCYPPSFCGTICVA